MHPAVSGRRFCTAALGALLAGAAAAPGEAQQGLSQRPIIVWGQRLLGVLPERTLNEDDVSAYGAGTVGELLDEVASENGEAPDEPVILVNGERVAGRSDIENFPPELVDQVEVLPRGSGTRVGASATRRVYNVVLKRNAATAVARAATRFATEGGWGGRRGDVTASRVNRSRRLNGTIRLSDEGALSEQERDVIQPAGSPADLGRFRTLRPALSGYHVSVTAADRLADWLSGSLTGKLIGNRRRSLLGLSPDEDPLRQRSRALTGDLDLSLNADAGPWLFTLVGDYRYDRRRTLTDQAAAALRTTARTTSAAADLTATGPLFDLPAGQLRLTLGAELERDSVSAFRSLDGDDVRDRYVQWTRGATAGLDIPIASRANNVLPALGELGASVQVKRMRVTGFGWLANQTFALNWQPAEWLRLFGSVTGGRNPPSVGFLRDPLLETPGVRYFDPLLGETVDVTQISGGNPALGDQRAADRRLSAYITPFKALPLQLTVEYLAIRNRDIVAALPPASDLILLAFPDRFVRDPVTGALTQVDIRPVQFARESQEQLRYGLNLNLPLGPGGAAAEGAPASTGDDDSSAPRPPRARSARPRLQLNLSHSWLLASELVIRDGFDPVDLLSRGAIGLGGGGRPRHEIDASLGYAERGLGIRLHAQHRGKSFLGLVGEGETDVLRFAPLTTFGLRAWAEPSRLAPDIAWLKGARLTLSVLNLTNRRQKVTDSAGQVPLAYQRAYQDPLGRTVEIELRKAF